MNTNADERYSKTARRTRAQENSAFQENITRDLETYARAKDFWNVYVIISRLRILY